MRFTRVDVLFAMTIAGLINIAMLVVAAKVFYGSGLLHVDSLEGAHRTLEPILGAHSSTLFALALLGSGLSSSTVGTMSGQVVMQGFVRRQVPLWLRRGVTMVPAFVVIAIGVDPTRTLVLSQVVLSFGIPFALIPLVLFTSKRDVMGSLINKPAHDRCGGGDHGRDLRAERLPDRADAGALERRSRASLCGSRPAPCSASA